MSELSKPKTADGVEKTRLPWLGAGLRSGLFWAVFLLLNFLLFLPAYWLLDSAALPYPAPAADMGQIAITLFLRRDNLDPWRFNLEFTLLVALWALRPGLRRGRRGAAWRVLLVAVYLTAFCYAIVESLSIAFYQQDPVFYVQVRLVLDGLPFLARHMALPPVTLAAALLGAAGALAVLLRALAWLTANNQASALGLRSRNGLAALAAFVAISALLNGRSPAGQPSVVSCLTCKLGQNMERSWAAAKQVQAIKRSDAGQIEATRGYDLATRPDIYLIFVESYGGVLYQRPSLERPYALLLEELEEALGREGWQAATILSESPSWGGGSWMAYTSMLTGRRLDSHPAYLALLERYAVADYPHLGRALQDMGYFHGRVTALPAEIDEQQWLQYQRFFGTDRWLRYGDLDYHGAHYGWGPAPPDQFVLALADERLQAEAREQPLFLFMITQNSHYPWQDVPPLAADWRTLDDESVPSVTPLVSVPRVAVSLQDYRAAIQYELAFLTRFIIEQADKDAIIILVGDHQPGYITRKKDGYQTPLHIISQDEEFLRSLEPYGFNAGLLLDDPTPAMKHEGFYSLFLRVFLARYGRGDRTLPPYLPAGVQVP